MVPASTPHPGSGRLFNRPQPRCFPKSAKLAAVPGTAILIASALSAEIAMLLGQRLSREYDLRRRGATTSHSAIIVNTTIKAANLMAISVTKVADKYQTIN